VQSLEWSLTGDSFLVTTGTATSKVHWRDETHTQRCGNTYCRTEQLLHYSPLTYSAILTMVGSTRQYSAVLGRARQCTSEHTALSLSADAPLSACGPPSGPPAQRGSPSSEWHTSRGYASAALPIPCPRLLPHVCARLSALVSYVADGVRAAARLRAHWCYGPTNSYAHTASSIVRRKLKQS
jgi:hypothetical protein